MQDKKARFRCGQLCATPAALDKVGRAGLSILRAGILRDRPARGQGGINSDSAKNGKEQFFEKDRAVSNYQPDAFGLQVL